MNKVARDCWLLYQQERDEQHRNAANEIERLEHACAEVRHLCNESLGYHDSAAELAADILKAMVARDYSKCSRKNVGQCVRQQSGCALSIWAGTGWAPRCWELHDHAREANSK